MVGTRDSEFPSDGPACKYAALWDKGHCFDGIRLGFFCATRVQELLTTGLLVRNDTVRLYVERIANEMERVSTLAAGARRPQQWDDVFWDVFRQCVTDDDYWLSISEIGVLS